MAMAVRILVYDANKLQISFKVLGSLYLKYLKRVLKFRVLPESKSLKILDETWFGY